MNVLEKILEEIEEKRKGMIDMSDEEPELCDVEDWLEEGEKDGKMKAYQEIEEIIRTHIEHLPNADAEEKFIICTLGGDGVLSEYDDTYDVVIHCTSKADQEQTVKLIKDSNWIPVSERLPDSNDYILLSFSNFSLPMVGRFEDEAFYLGDDDEGDTCVSQDLFVNAWRPLPEPYRTIEE